MPKKSSLDINPAISAPAEPQPVAKASYQPSSHVEDKMDQILEYLHRMERRDRIRTTGGFFRSLISLIPIALLLWSTWYFFTHGQELMQQITQEAVKQSAEYSQGSLMEQLEQYMQQTPGR